MRPLTLSRGWSLKAPLPHPFPQGTGFQHSNFRGHGHSIPVPPGIALQAGSACARVRTWVHVCSGQSRPTPLT